MTNIEHNKRATTDVAIDDPSTLEDRADIAFNEREHTHEDHDDCPTDIEGRAIVGVENDDGDYLVLIHDAWEIALLPYGTVDSGDDWASTARQEVEGQTGFSIELEGIEAARRVDHVVDGERQGTTHDVVFRGTPVDGEIQACKRTADAGSDGWRATWVDALPDGIAAPEGTPREDIRRFLG